MFLTEEEFVNNTETKNFSQNVSLSYHLEDRNKNVPKLRFKGYNDEWKRVKTEEIFENISIKNNPLLPVLAVTQDKGVILRESCGINIKYENKSLKSYKIVKPGNFIISLRSFQGGLEYSELEGIVSPAYTILNNKQNISYDFFKYYFKTYNFIKSLNIAVEGIRDGKQISYNSFKDIKIAFPSLSEQEKIASFLILVDKKIEKQKELVELLKKYKRGLLSAMFSQKLRFKDDKGNDYPTWEEKRLEEILKIKHGKSQKEIECTNGKYPILATGGEIGRTNSCLWNKPCVLIGRKGTIDKPQYMETPFWTVDTLFYSEVFKDNNAKYLYYLFNTINWKKYDESTGVPSLSAKTIERIKVTLSISYTEQTIISKNLSKFDDKIQQEECLLNYLQTYKKGLLQQMFI